jgi:hypothetical protein
LTPVAPSNVGASAYVASKVSSLKILEYLAAERLDLTVINPHPGAVHGDDGRVEHARRE